MNTSEKITSGIGLFVIVFWLFMLGCWIGNVYKLSQCDFEPSWKGEIVHAIGLVPIISIITVWNDDK